MSSNTKTNVMAEFDGGLAILFAGLGGLGLALVPSWLPNIGRYPTDVIGCFSVALILLGLWLGIIATSRKLRGYRIPESLVGWWDNKMMTRNRLLVAFPALLTALLLGPWTYIAFTPADAAPPSPPSTGPQTGAAQGPASEGIHNGPTTNNFYPAVPLSPKPKPHAATKKTGRFSEACKKAEEARFEAAASPEIRPLLMRRYTLTQFYDELLDNISPREIRMDDPEAIEYYNSRLKETKADWRVTPENRDKLFGMVCIDCSSDQSENGVVLDHSNGNTFDRLRMDHTKNPFSLSHSDNNSFKDAEVNEHPDGLPEQPPAPPLKECES